MRHGKAETVVEALQVAAHALSEAESFADGVLSDLENLLDNMRRYNDGDGVDTLIDGINEFISEVENIISGLR